MKKTITPKLQLLLVAALCLLTIALFLRDDRVKPGPPVHATITWRKTACTGAADGRFRILTEPGYYPVGTEGIPFEVTNEGEYAGEISKPRLEARRGDAWYSVDVPPGDATMELLGCAPGTTQKWYLYPLDLPAGHYRGVFWLIQEDGWFAYEFELY